MNLQSAASPLKPLSPSAMNIPILRVEKLTVSAGARQLLRNVSLEVPATGVFGIIGPSGAGKSTLLKCVNRLAELSPGLQVDGQVLFHGKPIYSEQQNADDLRSRIGILFQQPVIFPASILANVLFGVKRLGRSSRREWPAVAEKALHNASLWDEVKDRLKQPAQRLSVGQQQRLCLARTLAIEPEVILMDEPTSALDPKSTEAIEVLIACLKARCAILLVTHNVSQARRVCDQVAFIGVRDGAGQVLCSGTVDDVLAAAEVSEISNYCCQNTT